MTDVTRILQAIDQGDSHAADQLLPLVYDELRKLASAKLAKENPGQTLDATALVHEAYLRLVDVDNAQHWNGRGHFFAAAAEAMRRILVESARRKQTERHGGRFKRAVLEDLDALAVQAPQSTDLLAVDEALERLTNHDATAGQLLKLRYFGGLSVTEAAEALGLSRTDAYRQWTFVRAWLRCELSGTEIGR
jgi:RNA polymerase sigma factor (TIGR02999 family)